MIRKYILKLGLYITIILYLISLNNTVSVHAQNMFKEEHANIRAAIIEWRYKTVDGKLYKRLYDYTNQRWIDDWILC